MIQMINFNSFQFFWIMSIKKLLKIMNLPLNLMKQEKLFETYDIWNIEANKKSDLEHEMLSEMSKNKRESLGGLKFSNVKRITK